MKKIVEYRKLLGADKNIKLNELKTLYRNFMKEYHPDKFQDDSQRSVGEEKSRQIIEAYHALVSIAPETTESQLEDYTNTISTSGIADIEYKAKRLRIEFADGSVYEYLGVPENTYVKLVNADSQSRFLRRHISTAFLYRQVSKTGVAV
ncbi:MAG: KTSC domain-containing protein [Bacteroidota bacterium]